MKVGIFSFHTQYSVDTAVLAKRAEELGFESFWVPEHAILPVLATSRFPGSFYDGLIPDHYSWVVDPFVALARASAVTKTIKLGTGICLVPERDPLLLAKEIATLDYFSGGRFVFGIGAGWLQEETEIMGGDFPHRWTQTREAVLVMKELWTKDQPEFHGRYYDFPPVLSLPKPAHKPHPPVLIGGNSKNVLKRVVEWGDGWIPGSNDVGVAGIKRGRAVLNELAEKAGRDPASIEVTAFGGSGAYRDSAFKAALEEAGADRMTVWLIHRDYEDEALAEMEQIARWFL